VHAFGRNSNHPYDIAPLESWNRYRDILLTLEDGDFLYFNLVSKNTDLHYAVFQHTETSTQFYKATLNWDGEKWILRQTNGSEMFFPRLTAAMLTQGAAMEIRDALGNKLELQRDRKRNLLEILTPHGHWVRFTYDNQARITRAEDDTGKWVRYGYSGDNYGMLLYAASSSGEERHYQYQGVLMTAILDEHKQVLLRNTYKSNVLVRQAYANGDIFQYRYIWAAKPSYYADKVVVTLPDGSFREVFPADSVPDYLRKQRFELQ
jgi:YD repeat-containing protein